MVGTACRKLYTCRRVITLLTVLPLLAGLFIGCSVQVTPDVDELLSLGERYLSDDNTQAAAVFLKVVEIEPKILRGYTGAAEAYVRLGRTSDAIAILRKGLTAIGPDERLQRMLYELAGSDLSPTDTPPPAPTPEPTPEPAPTPEPEPPSEADFVVQWRDPAFEDMIRLGLDKPEGDIWRSELDFVTSLSILGNTHCLINEFSFSYCIRSEKLIAFYSVGSEEDKIEYTERGDIRDLSDVANFKNLSRLTVVANHVSDLSPLLAREEQLAGHCNFFANDIADTSMLELFSTKHDDGTFTPMYQFVEVGDSLPDWNT